MPRPAANARRTELYPQIKQMRDKGLKFKEIAQCLGLSRSMVSDYYHDPTGARERGRKLKRTGTCSDCGRTTYNNGSVKLPARCQACDLDKRHREAAERILQAFKDWHELYGCVPSAREWRTVAAKSKLEEPQRWPFTGEVQLIFGSWNAGVAAAGFTPRQVGVWEKRQGVKRVLS
jgi:predicted transcriptional regulator